MLELLVAIGNLESLINLVLENILYVPIAFLVAYTFCVQVVARI